MWEQILELEEKMATGNSAIAMQTQAIGTECTELNDQKSTLNAIENTLEVKLPERLRDFKQEVTKDFVTNTATASASAGSDPDTATLAWGLILLNVRTAHLRASLRHSSIKSMEKRCAWGPFLSARSMRWKCGR